MLKIFNYQMKRTVLYVIDYRMATGMEALVGWLFLRQEYNRLVYLISQGLEKLGRMPDPEGDKT